MKNRFSCRPLWKLIPALSLIGCGNIVLQTTSEPEQNSNLLNSDAGVVSDTFFVSGPTLFDPCGKPVILRGVNEMVTFVPDGKDGNPYFDDIVTTGANSVRIYWRTTDTADELDRLLSNAETHKLIPIIYVFNYPGPTTPSSSTSVSQAAKFWTQQDIIPIVLKHQQWLIITLRERDLAAISTHLPSRQLMGQTLILSRVPEQFALRTTHGRICFSVPTLGGRLTPLRRSRARLRRLRMQPCLS